MVAARELPGPLDRDDVLGLLDNAEGVGVAARIGADSAERVLGDIAADRAELDLGLDLGERRDEPLDVGFVGREQVEGDALRALGPDPGQLPEFVDKVLDHAFIHE